MANNSFQLSQLVTRLWQKTQAGSISWEQISGRYSYQTRQGDFVILISGSGPTTTSYGFTPNVSLNVKRLDGRDVGNAQSGGQNALSTIYNGQEKLTAEGDGALTQMYAYLSNRNTDLDELLKTLG